jgi:phage gp45-like
MGGQFLGRMMSGIIVDNTTNDSKFVRVRIAGVDDGIPDDKLPWSGVARPLFRGAGQSAGIWSRPRVNSRVLGMFDGGDRDSFVVMFELENPAGTVGWEKDEWGLQDEVGTHIKVKVNETLEIKHKGATILIDSGGKVTVNGTTLEFVGPATFKDDVKMEKSLTVTTETTTAGIAFTTHKHGGVSTGSSQTSVPE